MTDKPLLLYGDCVHRMKEIPDGSVDAIITDPPYPCIKREYGMMTEAKWHAMMRLVVAESRRILKPKGSAVFILQPNSKKIGQMRLWLWEFMVWVGKEWGIIQDAYYWNTAAMPEAHAIQGKLMRQSVKTTVWCGSADCWRDQDAVLWTVAEASKVAVTCARAKNAKRHNSPSGQGVTKSKVLNTSIIRGGVTPFNLYPTNHGAGKSSRVAGFHGHGAGTPFLVCDWWVRYISPPGGVICDPFMGSGTTGLAAIKLGRKFIGIENYRKYYDMSCKRINELCSAV